MTEKYQIFYYNAATGDEIMQYFPERDRFQLKVGQTLKTKVRGSNNYYYKIVDIQDDLHTKVYLKRVYLHYSDIIKLVVIIILCKYIFKLYLDFLLS
jgi:hypothetical protein